MVIILLRQRKFCVLNDGYGFSWGAERFNSNCFTYIFWVETIFFSMLQPLSGGVQNRKVE
jgi:hypothetical protein